MASGTPVVASRVGGLTKLIKNGHTGYLVPFRRARSFTDKLEVILSNSSLQDAMRESARCAAMEYGWEEVAKNLAEFYMSLFTEFSLISKHAVKSV
jgi:D-inositol-3-phosphate glycosyltransferase